MTQQGASGTGHLCAADWAIHLCPEDSSDCKEWGGGGAGVGAHKACAALVRGLR